MCEKAFLITVIWEVTGLWWAGGLVACRDAKPPAMLKTVPQNEELSC